LPEPQVGKPVVLAQVAVRDEVLVVVVTTVKVVVANEKAKRLSLSTPSGTLKPDWIWKGTICSVALEVSLLMGFKPSLVDL